MSHEHNHHHHYDSAEELQALVEYMVKHNISHTEELKKLVENFEGDSEKSEALTKAISFYEKGNEELSKLLK